MTSYKLLRQGIRLSADQEDFVYRRTRAFAEHGLHLPLLHLLGEAYLQGMRDVLAALATNPSDGRG